MDGKPETTIHFHHVYSRKEIGAPQKYSKLRHDCCVTRLLHIKKYKLFYVIMSTDINWSHDFSLYAPPSRPPAIIPTSFPKYSSLNFKMADVLHLDSENEFDILSIRETFYTEDA